MTKVTRLTINDGAGGQNRRIHLREISGDIDAPLETVGQDLRAARLRRGDDLATVSRVLKIRREHLEALEEDRLEALPGRTYAIGFVRSYAEYLGLDSGQHVERYKTEIAGRSDSVATVHVIDEEDRHLPQGWVIMAGVVLVLLAYGAYHLIISANQLLSQPVTPAPPQATAVSKPVKQEATAPDSHTRAQSLEETATGASVQTADLGKSPVKAPGDATANSRIFAEGSPSGAEQAQIDSAPQIASLPRGQVYGAQNIEPRVVLRVRAATRILVQGPEKAVLINRTMKPGDIYQVPNVVGLTLTTPNGGAVEVDLDGAAMGLAGRNQQMTEALSLDPQAIVDRYNGGG